MKGTIEKINAQRGMVAVKTPSGYSVFEIVSGEFNVGDEVSWQGDKPLGSAEINNLTCGERESVYFQNHDVSQGNLNGQLLY